jgi:serine/threonine protein kinase
MIYLLYPLMEKDLSKVIDEKEILTETEIIYFFIQLIIAIWNLKFYYRIQHRDLKPANILRYKKNWYAISDFGSCKFKFDQ